MSHSFQNRARRVVRQVWILSAVVVCMVFCSVAAHAATTEEHLARYESLKEQLETLQKANTKRSKQREPWQKLAAAFFSLYNEERGWSNRPAALFRSGVALQELAQRSGLRRDAEAAEERYQLLIKRYSSSVLADDAMFQVVEVRLRLRKDREGALQAIQELCERWPYGDMFKPARELAVSIAPKEARKIPQQTQKIPPQKPLRTRLKVHDILIDAGHGGKDPGAQHNGVTERAVALDLSKRVGVILAAGGLKVHYTRYTDEQWVPLEERAEMVRKTGSDLFLSIHVNANTKPEIQGFETYYFDFARSSSAARLAAAENALSRHPFKGLEKMSPEEVIGIQTYASRRLARRVHRATLNYVEKKGYPTHDGGIKTAPFLVLRKAGVPCVLIEVGYCSNVQEAKYLASSKYRAALARGIANGILAYVRNR